MNNNINLERDPFDIEGIDFIVAPHTSQMNSEVKRIIKELSTKSSETKTSFPIFLIAQTAESIPEIKSWLAKFNSATVSVVTYQGLIVELWEIYGDGRTIIDDNYLRHACRVAMKEVTGKTPSNPAITLASNMFDSTEAANDSKMEEILSLQARSGKKIAAQIVAHVEKLIDENNGIHQNRAAVIIAKAFRDNANRPQLTIVSEDPSENDASQRKFYETLADIADIHVVRRDAADVDIQQMVKSIDCRFAVSLGHHAYPKTVAGVVTSLIDEGIQPTDIALVSADLSSKALPLLNALQDANIAFETVLSLPVRQTAIGIWAYNFELWREYIDNPTDADDSELAQIVEKLCDSPYVQNLINEDTDLNMLLFDIASGNKPEELPELVELMLSDDPWNVLSYICIDNHPEGIDSAQHIDDCKIADKIHTFITANKNAEIAYDLEDLLAINVRLNRASGEVKDRVEIISRSEASYDHHSNIIVCDMDASSCASYSQPSPFACLTDEIGSSPDSWLLARLLRFQIVDILRHGQDGTVTFVRSANSPSGSELPPAPIYTEIAEAFGKLDDYGLPVDIASNRRTLFAESNIIAKLVANAESGQYQEHIQGENLANPMTTFVKPHKDGGVHKFSPTDLELYWNCPRKWLVSRNGVGYDEDTEPTLSDARIKGNIMHKTFEKYYMNYGKLNYRKNLDDDKQAEQALKDAFDEALRDSFGGEVPTSHNKRDDYAKENLYNMARELIQKDQTFLPNFTPYLFEEYVEGEISGLRVGGIIDRVDISEELSPDGKRYAVIIDYKGSPDAEYGWDTTSNQPKLRIQGLLYALLFESKHPNMEVAGIIYRGYTKGDIQSISWVPLDADSKTNETRDGFREKMEIFKAMFNTMAKDLTEGIYPIAPRDSKKDACKYCPVASGCSGKVEN